MAESNRESRGWTFEHGQYHVKGGAVDAAMLEPGLYRIDADELGLAFILQRQVTDNLIPLPDETSRTVIENITQFWASEARYRKHGLLYKRGILLYGPPGSGKTVTLTLLGKELIAQGGVVVLFDNPGLVTMGLQAIRAIEPRRRMICIIEDIDEVINRFSTASVTSLLDGEAQVDGVVTIAATNHFDKLPAVITNRPSRFDECIYVGMPSLASRVAWLETKRSEEFPGAEIQRWAVDTEGFSVAHLKELYIAVICLGHPYARTLTRLRKMLGLMEPEAPEEPHKGQAPIFGMGLAGVLTAPAPESTVSA